MAVRLKVCKHSFPGSVHARPERFALGSSGSTPLHTHGPEAGTVLRLGNQEARGLAAATLLVSAGPGLDPRLRARELRCV